MAKKYPLRILVAEDNIVNQLVIRRILAKIGYEIVIAQNGREVACKWKIGSAAVRQGWTGS